MKTSKLIAIFLAAFAITSYAATANELKTTIETYGLTAALSPPSATGGTDVTVTGTATNKTTGLSLDIGSSINVYWEASLSGSISAPVPADANPNCLVSISGSGNFTVRDGGKIEQTGNGCGLYNSGKASISKGGEVSAASGGIAVYNNSTNGMGIGGKVSVSGLRGTAVYNNSGILRIQGSAEILAIGTNNLAIRNVSPGTVSMSHGIVFGYGATDANIIEGGYEQQSGGTNVIIAWNKPTGNNPTYTIGTSDDIFKKPATATAVWSNKAGKSGIDYAYSNNNAENTGFIEINGVTVVNPSSSSGQNPSSSSIGGSSSSGEQTPIRPPQVATGNLRVQAINNAILLENLPAGAKVEVYNLQGKCIFSSGESLNRANRGSDNLTITLQTKGVYIVKVSAVNLKILPIVVPYAGKAT